MYSSYIIDACWERRNLFVQVLITAAPPWGGSRSLPMVIQNHCVAATANIQSHSCFSAQEAGFTASRPGISCCHPREERQPETQTQRQTCGLTVVRTAAPEPAASSRNLQLPSDMNYHQSMGTSIQIPIRTARHLPEDVGGLCWPIRR